MVFSKYLKQLYADIVEKYKLHNGLTTEEVLNLLSTLDKEKSRASCKKDKLWETWDLMINELLGQVEYDPVDFMQ